MEIFEFKERLVIVKHLGAIAIVAFLVICQISALIGEHSGALAYIAWQLLLSAIIGAAVLVIYNFKGLVRADRSGVNIKILLFGILLFERSYEYGDIKRVSCTVEKHNTKNLKYYDMVFVFMLSGGNAGAFSHSAAPQSHLSIGRFARRIKEFFKAFDPKELCFSKRLKIRFDLDRTDPSGYYAAISGEPMMQLYDFVMINRKRVFDERYPQ